MDGYLKFVVGSMLAGAFAVGCGGQAGTANANRAALVPGPDAPSHTPANPRPSAEAIDAHARQEVAALTRQIERDPYDYIALNERAKRYLTLARSTGDEAFFAKAEADATKSAGLQKAKNAGARLILARCCLAVHKFREAIEYANAALDIAPELHFARGLRGDAQMALGNYAEARADFEAYAAADPGLASWSRVAHIENVYGKTDAAMALFVQAREKYADPDPEPAAWIRLMIGVLFLKKGDLATARKHFEDSLAVAPGYYLALEHIAETYEIVGNDAAARPYLEQAVAINRSPELLDRLADMEERAGKPELAATLRAEALAEVEALVASGHQGHFRALAEMLMGREIELPRALEMARKDAAIRGDVHTHHVLAQALRLNGHLDEALAAAEQSLAHGTPDAELWAEKARILEALGKKEESLKAWEAARVLNPYCTPQ